MFEFSNRVVSESAGHACRGISPERRKYQNAGGTRDAGVNLA